MSLYSAVSVPRKITFSFSFIICPLNSWPPVFQASRKLLWFSLVLTLLVNQFQFCPQYTITWVAFLRTSRDRYRIQWALCRVLIFYLLFLFFINIFIFLGNYAQKWSRCCCSWIVRMWWSRLCIRSRCKPFGCKFLARFSRLWSSMCSDNCWGEQTVRNYRKTQSGNSF